ncbi:MAG: CDP-archaeol synthase [Betaproteobacteria bacterium]|nr:CDP-archaeol synthase [Betaproteobacteria bacterium]
MTEFIPDPLAAALYLVIAMSTAGLVHVAWLRSRVAKGFSAPLDRGLTLRGRRLLGDNKMLRGFVAMPPAAALSFVLWGAIWGRLPLATDLWPLTTSQFALLGFACGIAFMLAELPNSFVKRQLDIVPGHAASSAPLRALFFIVDRCDSVLGVLILTSLLLPLPALTWLWVLLLGPCMHAMFSILLHRVGVKARAL